MALSSLYVPKI